MTCFKKIGPKIPFYCEQWRIIVLLLSVIILPVTPARSMERHIPNDLTEMSIEDLMSIEVTIASRKTQQLSKTAAAVFAITQEDIRRSGVTSIPEALQMAPGLQVARINASQWAISSRGFNGQYSDKLLVLMDGRSVYTPLFSGVFWDVQDTLLEDIARIEVIRGPGASLWGANAVNGVINVVTKPTTETQGILVSTGHGSEEKYFGRIRYGGEIGESAHYRIYAKYFKRGGAVDAVGEDTPDQWHVSRGGGRIDWDLSPNSLLTLQGDYYEGKGEAEIFAVAPVPPYQWDQGETSVSSGGNILGRWQHSFSEASDFMLQAYYDITKREFLLITDTWETSDLDFQHRLNLSERQELIWGLGYRLVHGDIKNRNIISYGNPKQETRLFSFFVQDEITIWPDSLSVTIGSKYEKFDYTGSEIQPNIRLLWTPVPQHTIWAAILRAVRTPSQNDRNIHFYQPDKWDLGLPLWEYLGNPEFDSEKLTAYELGWRLYRGDGFSLDLALFYNRYSDLRTIMFGFPYLDGTPLQVIVPITPVNGMKGYTYGAELAIDYRPTTWWRLQGVYSYLQLQMHDPTTLGRYSKAVEGNSPKHQFSLRPSLDITTDIELDLWVRYVDNLSSPYQQAISSIFTMDVRLGWKPTDNLEIDIVGQNLLDSHHPEYIPEMVGIVPTEVQRGIYGKLTWHF